MGCCAGRYEKGPLGDDKENCVGLGFHPFGIYALFVDGTIKRVSDKRWAGVHGAVSDGFENVVCFHDFSVYALSYYEPDPAEPKVLNNERWVFAQAVVRTPADPVNVVCFHNQGVYSVSLKTGESKQVSSERWAGISAAALNPNDPTHVYLFHTWGLYKVSLTDFTHESLGTSYWGQARAAVYCSKLDGILCFHFSGIYFVSLTDGSYRKVNTTFFGWDYAVAAVETKEPGQVFVLDRYGMYIVNADDGTYNKLNGEQWHMLSGFAPFGESAFVSCRPYRKPQKGGDKQES
mmetsp:Transcript_27814/g.64213  ORF Transcript_27814/g.64213 Transcript_27814/m.64213 type:complete len:291 (+) Transcript_27814:61-933(+)